jgi:steroid delta-isomerase-like uncharacterized protein
MVEAHQRMAVSQRDFTEVWADRDLGAVADIYTADFRGHGFPVTESVTRSQYRRLVSVFQHAFPDCRIEMLDLRADDEFVYADWRFQGTHRGGPAGLPGSDATVSFTGSGRHRHRDGKVVEVWLDVDWSELIRQLGAGYWTSLRRAVAAHLDPA